MAKKIQNVGEYIAAAPAWARVTLKELRRVIRSAAPNATESLSYHMPYYAESGRVAYFGVHSNHCSFHWVSTEDKRNFSQDLTSFHLVGSTIHILRGEKVPKGLIRKIVRAHVKRNAANKK